MFKNTLIYSKIFRKITPKLSFPCKKFNYKRERKRFKNFNIKCKLYFLASLSIVTLDSDDRERNQLTGARMATARASPLFNKQVEHRVWHR